MALLATGLVYGYTAAATAEGVDLTVSTYLGGSNEDTIRDVAIDASGNIYITGGTDSANLPTTSLAYDRTLNTSGSPIHDVYIAKLTPAGTLVWATYLGGPNYDRAYAIEVDGAGYVYVAGRAGSGFPTTTGVLQRTFAGDNQANALYGTQDGFIAKISPDGRQLVWSTYFGDPGRAFIRDLALNPSCTQNCEVFVVLTAVAQSVSHVTAGAYDTTFNGLEDGVVARIAADGRSVIWASYLGGSSLDLGTPSIRVDAAGQAVVCGYTDSSNLPTTPNAFDRTYNGNGDLHIAKFTANGAGLVFATYLGGSAVEFTETHGLALDGMGHPIVAATTRSADFPVTPGAFQTTYGGSGGSGSGANSNYPGDGFVTLLSVDGTQILASTYLGGSEGEGIEGVAVGLAGRVFVSGATYSPDFPTTPSGFQGFHDGQGDLFAAVLSPDLSELVYGTFLGGSRTDYGRTATADSNGSFVIAGQSQSSDFPLLGALQTSNRGDWDGVFAKFVFQGGCAVPGADCDDGNPCTVEDRCDDAGECTGIQLTGCEPCDVPQDCDDGVSCTADQCEGNICVHTDACADDGQPCNGVEQCDLGTGACVSSGDPCPGMCNPAVGCPCQSPGAWAAGPRYLEVEPMPPGSTSPVKIVVTSPNRPCWQGYAKTPIPIDINEDGVIDGSVAELTSVESQAASLTPQQWGGVVFLRGPEIVPSDQTDTGIEAVFYEISADCGAVLTPPAVVDMPVWGDVDHNGTANGSDVLLTVLGFQHRFEPLVPGTLPADDLTGTDPCRPDGLVNGLDVQRAVLAFQGQQFADVATCGTTCP